MYWLPQVKIQYLIVSREIVLTICYQRKLLTNCCYLGHAATCLFSFFTYKTRGILQTSAKIILFLETNYMYIKMIRKAIISCCVCVKNVHVLSLLKSLLIYSHFYINQHILPKTDYMKYIVRWIIKEHNYVKA